MYWCVLNIKKEKKFSRDISVVKDTHLDKFGKFQRTKLLKTREIERESGIGKLKQGAIKIM